MKNFLSNLWSLLVGSRKDDGSTRLRVDYDSFTCRLRVWPLKLVSVLAILLTIGIGNAWGETITLNAAALDLGGSYTSSSKDVSNVTFQWVDLCKQTYIQAKASSGELWNTTVVPGKITNVSTTNNGTSRTSTLYWGTTAKPTTNSSSISGTSSTNSPANSCFGYIHITRGSNAQKWTQVVITYTPATITLGKTSITGLDYTAGSGPSSSGTFTVSGSNIPANLTVTAPTNFEVSLDGSSWGTTKTINVTLTGSASAGTLSATTVYVRLASGKSVGSYNGNVSIAMAGCKTISSVNPKTVAVSGTVSASAYTVGWSITSGGGSLSSTSGTSTTVTPASGWRYASPAYTVLTGAASVFQSTNTFTATPTANSTIRINMEEIPSHSIHFNTGGLVAIADAEDIPEGDTYNITETPAASLSGDCEYSTFVGWTTASSIADASICPSTITSYTMSTADATLYAVYSKTTGGSGAAVGTIMFSEDWTGDTGGNTPSSPTASGSVVYNSASITYTWANGGSTTQTYVDGGPNDNENILVSKGSGYWKVSGIPTGGATTLTVSYAISGSGSITLSTSTTNVSVSGTTVTIGDPSNISSFDLTFTNALSSNCRIDDISVEVATTSNAGTTTYSLDARCDAPTITVSTTEIDFGDKKAGPGHSISHTATFTVSGENLTDDIELEISGVDNTLFTIDEDKLEPTAGSVATTTITVTWTPSAAFNQTYIHINSDGATEKIVHLKGTGQWEVTWMKDGSELTTTLTTNVAGQHRPTLPDNPTSCDAVESNVFYGWSTSEWSGKIDNLAGKTIYLSGGSMPNVSDNSTVYYAVFVKRTGSVTEVTDELTYTSFYSACTPSGANTAGSYTDFSGKSGSASDAVYAGNLYKHGNGPANCHDYIQMRTTNSNSGVVTTTSGGKAKKVTVTWNSDTEDGRTVDIYGKNTAYTDATDLYNNGTKGTKIGSIVYGTSTELTIDDDYEYIGIRSNSNALYLDEISIDWQEGDYTYSKFLTTCCDYNITLSNPTITGTGATITFDKSSPVATCTGETEVEATVTVTNGYKVTALSFSGGDVAIDPAISTPLTSTQVYTLTFDQNTNATLTTTATVEALQDRYYDYMHDNVQKFLKEGNYNTVPTLSSKSAATAAGCKDNHYKFKGWVAESDVNDDGSLKGGYTLITGGTTGKYATGTNYYAVWAEEE